jgi:L-ascorbate metabolism protein UlaG (beta-lactamase superfamily)
MKGAIKLRLSLLTFFLALIAFLSLTACRATISTSDQKATLLSDHSDGTLYFNPGSAYSPSQEPKRGSSVRIWGWLFGSEWPEWPELKDPSYGPPPAVRVPKGTLQITPVGHATFLIQMDGLNILVDPIWSDRCSPVSWIGPKRHMKPGLRFEDLPPIDIVLVSHNHYDHLDLPTLKKLAERGTPRALVPLGNLDLVRESGIPDVEEFDWWQSARLSSDVTVTLVPAQHFSCRTLWDRNRTLWGGFVVSGPSGNVFYSGDTGYGPHFREIARRFSPIAVALIPISPFRTQPANEALNDPNRSVHMGPTEAVQAHLDLGAQVSIAAHFRVFQLGSDGFDDAVYGLATSLKKRHLKPEAFIALSPGRSLDLTTHLNDIYSSASMRTITYR